MLPERLGGLEVDLKLERCRLFYWQVGWIWRTSITHAPKRRVRRPTESANLRTLPHFHKTVLNVFYRVAFRKKVYRSIDELQIDLDAWLSEYNEARPHQGRWCFGKTPMRTLLDAMPMAKEKMIAA
jgi:hypothetical protein